MKQKILVSVVSISLLFVAGCTLVPENTVQEEVANPASEYCEQNGGKLEIVPDEGGSRGKCNFEDGSFCEEWAFYHGECSQGRGDGNTVEIEEIQDNEEISQEDKEEIEGIIEEIEEINEAEELEREMVTCTADVKMCDDGTYVSRGGPNCEFGECPGVTLDESFVQETLEKYKSEGSELAESDIELMREMINIITE